MINAITYSPETRELRLLEMIASAINGANWKSPRNTPQSIFKDFVLPTVDEALNDDGLFSQWIADSIDTGAERGSTADSRRRAELAKLMRETLRKFQEGLKAKESEYMRAKDAAKAANVPAGYIRCACARFISSGGTDGLPCVVVGNMRYCKMSDVFAYLDSRRKRMI